MRIHAELSASTPRRVLAVSMLAALGVLLLWLVLTHPPRALGLSLFVGGLGLGALILAEAVRRATRHRVMLLGDRLVDSSGAELCRLADIRRVDRGTFAFKPSNGFMIVLDRPARRHWAPGLWWRSGRLVGVGGVTPGPQARVLAEAIDRTRMAP